MSEHTHDNPSLGGQRATRLGRPEILVVDDDPKNLVAIEAALGDFHGRLDMVRSGAEALHNLLEREYALILLDVHMPDLDGFETAKLIRQRAKTKHLPIIFVTAYDQSDSRVLEGYELGAVDFLFKPLVPEILRAKAQVFVELTRRAEEVRRQADQLRMHERRDAIARLERERQQWEQESLRREMEQQRALAEETQARAEQLAEIAAQREAAQNELARINAQLAESDRKKDEFLATLAHELRNPLAPLSYAVGVLGDEATPETRAICERMSRQLAHLTRLVDDLLDVSRVTSGKIELRKQVIDLREAIHQGVELARGAIGQRGSQLELDLGDDVVAVDADAVRLAQVVGNLLNNAARYTRRGGAVRVRLARDGDADASPGWATLSVHDDGPGIPESMLDTIFDAFVQGAEDAGGLGLGLHLADRLVRKHGGTIRASNPEEGGARFDIRLPVVDAELAARITPRPSGPPDRPLTIAVIEDQDDIRAMSMMLLERWGHTAYEADRGEDGIALVSARADELDVALVDIGLPDMQGYDVSMALNEQLGERCPPLIAVTGWGQRRDREKALAAGFTTHLVKPVRPEALREALGRVSRDDPRRARGRNPGEE